MARLTNLNRYVEMDLSLLSNNYLVLDPSLPSTESWIPFTLSLTIEGQPPHLYAADAGATLTLYETQRLISDIDRIHQEKLEGRTAEPLEFYCYEAYFELIITDNAEPDSVTVVIWFNMGALTDGVQHGYDRGYRFDVDLLTLEGFAHDLRQELQTVAGCTTDWS